MDKHRMTDVDAVMALEDGDGDELEQAKAMQTLVNSGTGWSLQGSYGRAMMDALEAGFVMLGPNPARDYYGNYIPSRHEVKAGTKGSRELVVENHGEEWAAALEELS